MLNESNGMPFCHETQTDGPIATVGDLKRILTENFNDSDILVICDSDGVPESSITAIWDSQYENDMMGDGGDEGQCFIRVS